MCQPREKPNAREIPIMKLGTSFIEMMIFMKTTNIQRGSRGSISGADDGTVNQT
jgi:hypothetical protein